MNSVNNFADDQNEAKFCKNNTIVCQYNN